jgi:3-hydroxyisobutyrate dehydrogenase-like beta-hydroxyacid dehydrogenase
LIPFGIIQSAKQGDIVLCMSTIDLLAARRFAERLGAKGVVMLDAPVSGGTHGATAATLSLSVIVGGPTETFAASEDLFRAIGKNVFHVGGLGHGLAMKLINNMLGQIATVAIAGALVLGKKAGLDPQKIYEVVRQYRQQRAVPIASSMKRRRSTAPNGMGVSTVIDAAARSSLKWRRRARVIASFRMIV